MGVKIRLIIVLIFLVLPGSILFPSGSRAQEKSGSSEGIFSLEAEMEGPEWKGELEKELRDVPLEPEEYSVSGAKHPQSLSRSSSTVTVLTEREIRAYAVLNLEELLRLVPGMEVLLVTPAVTQIGIRGFCPTGPSSLLVLVDGQEVNANFMGGILWNILPVTLDDIKRIEVIRGPGSALYGANAFSGVINIITKNPQEERPAEARAEAGAYPERLGAIFSKVKGAYSRPRLGVKLAADFAQMQNYTPDRETGSRVLRAYLRTHSDLPGNTQVDLHAGFASGESRYYAYLGELPVTDAYIAHFNLSGNRDRLKFHLNYFRYAFNLGLESPLFSRETTESLLPGLFPVPATTDNYETNLEYSLYPWRNDRLTFGLNYLLNLISSPSFVRENNWENRLGAYFQNEWSPLRVLDVILGFRFDFNSKTDLDYSPRLSAVYSPRRNHTFRVSLARSFRKPSFFEYGIEIEDLNALGQILNPDLGGRIISTPALGNEHLNAFELGYTGRFLRRLELSAALFYYQYRDIIYFSDNFFYENYGKLADSFGGELALNLLYSSSLRGFFNLALLEAVDKSSREEMARFINRDPRFKLNLGAAYAPLPGLSLSLIGNLTGPRKDQIVDPRYVFPFNQEITETIPLQFTLGFRLGYSFFQDRAEAGIRVYNLLGDRRRQYPGADWDYDIDGDGTAEATNFAGEKLGRIVTGFVRFSW